MTERDSERMRCPVCSETLRATNVEYLYDVGHNGTVYPSDVPLTLMPNADREQLYYCPNDACRIERLTLGDDNE